MIETQFAKGQESTLLKINLKHNQQKTNQTLTIYRDKKAQTTNRMIRRMVTMATTIKTKTE